MKIAINGFGRIGRLVFRLLEEKNIEVVAINDLTEPKELAHLLKYDTAHGNYLKDEISYNENNIIVKGREIKVYSKKDPFDLPWDKLNIDVVFECTGIFTSEEKSMAHIKAGARKVIISAPAKGVKTIVYNVNNDVLDGSELIISAASCTTNCLAPVVNLFDKYFGVEKGFMTTVHAYTNDQTVLDIAHSKGVNSRRGRAAASNIIPTSTGAASAIGLVLPNLKGRLDGIALRVPTITGSIIDLTLELNKNTSVQEIKEIFSKNENETIQITEDPIVSSDIIGSHLGALVDGQSIQVLEIDGKQLIKMLVWYDNEMGYSAQMVRCLQLLNNN